MESCCTCATILSAAPPYPSAKALPEDRRVACCARVICGDCIHRNSRFAEYCPYCQVSTGPSPLPQGLRDPPSYTPVAGRSSKTTTTTTTEVLASATAPPPPYTPSATVTTQPDPTDEKAALAASAAAGDKEAAPEDTLHFLDHEHDTVASLSLRYGVPAAALRRANNITSDHLLTARRTVLIPGEFYGGGVSLSPRPVEGEDEERRRSRIRRFMTSSKVADYDVATLYLEQAGYDLAAAVDAYFADEAWEREHPSRGKQPAKGHKNRGPFWRGL
ncbi:hypothetical protein ACO1O0_000661 [Amphichorda felina]